MSAGTQPFPDHVLSIYQSAVDDLARHTEEAAAAEAKGLASTAMVAAAGEVAARAIAARRGYHHCVRAWTPTW